MFNKRIKLLANVDDIGIIGRTKPDVTGFFGIIERKSVYIGLEVNEGKHIYVLTTSTDMRCIGVSYYRFLSATILSTL